MVKSELRLQYSGYAIFASKLISVATGFTFQFLLARALLANPSTSAQYNIWFNIADVITYFTLLGGVVPFWVMRYTARGKEAAIKTGVVSNTVLSGILTAVYLVLAPFILAALGISSNFLPLYLIAAVQIVELYALAVMESCLQAIKPQAIGYGLVIQQLIKVTLGYVLIVHLGLPLLGAVVSVLLSFGVQVAFYYSLIVEQLRQPIHWGYVKEWLKASTASIYNILGGQLTNFALIMLYNFGSNPNPDLIGARGYYGAAAQIALIITYASFLSYALYPKLIAEKRHEDITVSLKMVLMFAIPMTVGAVALADSYMALLSPELRVAWQVLIALAIDAFIVVLSTFFGSVLYGYENVDQEGMSFRALVRSKIFMVFSLPYLAAAITLPAAYFVLTTYGLHMPLEAALSVAVIITTAHIVAFAALQAILRGIVRFHMPWKSISKYTIASAVMGAVMYLAPHPFRITTTVAMTLVGAGIYLSIMLLIDKEMRALIQSVLRELKGMLFGFKLVAH